MIQMSEIRDWGISLWKNQTLRNLATAGTKLAIKASQGVAAQIGAAPAAIYSAFTKPKTASVIRHARQIITYDLLPLMLVNVMNQTLKDYLSPEDQDANDYSLSAAMATQTTLTIAKALCSVLDFRLRTSIAVHTALLMMEGVDASKEVNVNKQEICVQDKCSTMKFIKGSFRDIVAFYCTDVAIEIAGTIPVAGSVIKALLIIDRNGRYALTMITPDMCNSHQMRYLQQEQGTGLAFGSLHALVSYLINKSINYYAPFVPKVYYEELINKMTLVGQINIAAHITLPPLHSKMDNEHYLPNPIDLYQRGIGFCFDVVVLGLKKTLPQLKNQEKSINWSNVASISQFIWNNEVSKALKFVLLPPILQNNEGLRKDELFKANFNKLIKNIIDILYLMESKRESWLVKTTQKILGPEKTAYSLWILLGTPKLLSKLILTLMKDEQCMKALRQIRSELEHLLRPTDLTLAQTTDSSIPMRQVESPPANNLIGTFQTEILPVFDIQRNRSAESEDFPITREGEGLLVTSGPVPKSQTTRLRRNRFLDKNEDFNISRNTNASEILFDGAYNPRIKKTTAQVVEVAGENSSIYLPD